MKTSRQLLCKKGSMYYIYGKHTVVAALSNPKRYIKKIYCTEKTFFELKKKVEHLDFEIVSTNFINKKIGYDVAHQGIIAYVESVFLKNLNQMTFSEEVDRVIILDQMNDPQNIGSIIRSAVAFGIKKMLLPINKSPAESGAIAKAASGCLELIQIAQIVNLNNTIIQLKKKGFWILGLDLKGSEDLNFDNIKRLKKIAIVIGSEKKGIRHSLNESCDFLIKIPISPQVNSLNASNAATIICYKLRVSKT